MKNINNFVYPLLLLILPAAAFALCATNHKPEYCDCKCGKIAAGAVNYGSVEIVKDCCANKWGGYGGAGDKRCCSQSDISAGKTWDPVSKTCIVGGGSQSQPSVQSGYLVGLCKEATTNHTHHGVPGLADKYDIACQASEITSKAFYANGSKILVPANAKSISDIQKMECHWSLFGGSQEKQAYWSFYTIKGLMPTHNVATTKTWYFDSSLPWTTWSLGGTPVANYPICDGSSPSQICQSKSKGYVCMIASGALTCPTYTYTYCVATGDLKGGAVYIRGNKCAPAIASAQLVTCQ